MKGKIEARRGCSRLCYRNSVTGSLPNANTMPAYQRLSHADGSCDELQIGTMTYHDVHHHWHLDGVMNYELLDARLKPVKPNSKVAFCPQYFIRQTVDAAGILFEHNDANNTTGVWVTLGIGVPYSTGGPRPGV
jgi:hypothetical protein